MAERKRPRILNHDPGAVTWAREEAGLKKSEVALLCGCSPSLITEIEKGTRNATPARLLQLAEALDCPVVLLKRKRTVAA